MSEVLTILEEGCKGLEQRPLIILEDYHNMMKSDPDLHIAGFADVVHIVNDYSFINDAWACKLLILVNSLFSIAV